MIKGVLCSSAIIVVNLHKVIIIVKDIKCINYPLRGDLTIIKGGPDRRVIIFTNDVLDLSLK